MADFKDYFSGVAGEYALFRPVYPGDLYDWLIPLCSKKETAWDAGTGNGQVAVQLSRSFQKVYASDASQAQIAHATKSDNIEYGVYPSETTPSPSRSIDLITVGQALHWFDLNAFWKEVQRVAAPGAVLACWTYTHPVFEEEGLMDVLKAFYAEVYPYWPSERAYVEAHYDTIPFPFELISEIKLDMNYSFNLYSLMAYLRTWSSVQSYLKKNKTDPLVGFEENLRKEWGNSQQIRTCIFPLFARAFKVK